MADVSVRVGWADDAPAIAQVQLEVWRASYDGVLPVEVLEVDPEVAARAWRQSLGRPADARQRVLVALERNRVVGFTLTQPATDPDCDPGRDGELGELTIGPTDRGQGHGSRLLQAAVDTLRADGFVRAVHWALAGDDAQRAFLTGSGWEPDGAHRELDLDGSGDTTVKQVRLHTAIED